MGPVINKKQFDKIKNYIEIGKEEGKLEQGGGTDDSKGYFVEPTIISGLKSKDRIMQEEIFGPVVGFVKVNDFDEAIEVANDTDYGLTGAMITNNREHRIKAVNEFDVGNLYLNGGYTQQLLDTIHLVVSNVQVRTLKQVAQTTYYTYNKRLFQKCSNAS